VSLLAYPELTAVRILARRVPGPPHRRLGYPLERVMHFEKRKHLLIFSHHNLEYYLRDFERLE
jgi:hypothetical protein